jgi:hypothetical protein
LFCYEAAGAAGLAVLFGASAWRFARAMLGGWVSLVAYATRDRYQRCARPVCCSRRSWRLALKETLGARRIASCIMIACGAACLEGAMDDT